MASPAQRPQQLLRCKEGVPIGNGFCEECTDPALEHFGKAVQILEAALRAGSPNDTETRECENCGQHKPVEEMETVFLPGTGESYQCIDCRGGP
jgi:hypothetical protein